MTITIKGALHTISEITHGYSFDIIKNHMKIFNKKCTIKNIYNMFLSENAEDEANEDKSGK